MKKSVAITAIVALHAAVIGMLLVQAGCSSDQSETKPVQAKSTVEEIAVKQQAESDKAEATKEILPPEGSPVLRLAPTRPAYNLGGSNSTEVIVPAEPVKVDAKEKPVANDVALVVPAKPAANTSAYTVQKGDTLAKIAKKHNVSVKELLKVNNMKRTDRIQVGQEIAVPAPKADAQVAPTTVDTPKTEAVAVPSQEMSVYVVKKGDSLGRIARRNKTTVKHLMEINNLKNHNIRIGQKLNVAKNGAVAAESKPAKKSTPVAAGDGETIHVVASGETLGVLAKKYGTSVKIIMERNSVKDARKIRVGQKLVIVSKNAAPKAEPKKDTAKVEPTKPEQKTNSAVVEKEKPVQVKQDVPTAVTIPPVSTAQPVLTTPVSAPTTPAKDENIPVTEL